MVESERIKTTGAGGAAFSAVRHFLSCPGLPENVGTPRCNTTCERGIRFEDRRHKENQPRGPIR
ncbi:tryptophan 7-halogenase [Streptomyces griseomycini]|uniref:tryptophan 7-halogenase n=1 Tax=Streptomyces griseomycini TaxID=66895 RepID=UPI0027E56C14|nr:tryptophan 7-halogenase [Streptomyces griseomycini]